MAEIGPVDLTLRISGKEINNRPQADLTRYRHGTKDSQPKSPRLWTRSGDDQLNDRMLTIEQAYRAMAYFLEHEYEMTESDDLKAILGSPSKDILRTERAMDPVAWLDWRDAVERALIAEKRVAFHVCRPVIIRQRP
ncbi:hypothetical protein [Cupriavidus pampae]|nr:hypothetical protein [Cupriavidus pampae]